MATEVVKKPRIKKTISEKIPIKKAIPVKIVHKHLKKLSKLDSMPFNPIFTLSTTNNPTNKTFKTVKEVGDFLDSHALMYFEIPEADLDSIVFPETSSEFFHLFFVLNKKYNTLYVNQTSKVAPNKYRSLGEIYLVYKFYYSKIGWKMFLTNFFSHLKESVKEGILKGDISSVERVSLPDTLSSLLCGTIHRRIFNVHNISGRSGVNTFYNESAKDEFGFEMKDYLDFIA